MISEAELNLLFRYGMSLTHNEATAYDLLQDALEYYLQRKDAIKKPLIYIQRTIRSRYIDQLRKQQRYPQEQWQENNDYPIELGMDGLEKIWIERDILDLLWSKLNLYERELLHLWAVEEYTAQEIADYLEAPRGTILSRIHRLRHKLSELVSSLDVSSIHEVKP